MSHHTVAISQPQPTTIEKDSVSIFEHLSQDQLLQLHLKTDLKTLIKKKAKKENHTAVFSYTNEKGISETWDIKVRARGNMRNKICFLPPLKIDFSKSDLRAAGIKGKYDNLKLVVHCKNGSAYDDFVLREYLAYKLYNELTPISFRVQLVKLTLEDTEGKQKTIETYGFLIENDKELASRLNGRIINSKFIKQAALHPTLFDQFCLFQFLIGNTDWYILNKHNIKPLRVEGYKRPIAVPYDFDYAGLVNAPYASHNEKLPVTNILDRFYLGVCRTEQDLTLSIEIFKDKKDSFLQIAQSLSELSEKSQKHVTSYLNEFYTIIENPKTYQRNIVEHCDKYIKIDNPEK